MMTGRSQASCASFHGTIVHLGAGLCRELPRYLERGPRKIILVEADQERAQQLEKKTAAYDNVHVIAGAVAATAGTGTLNCFNLRDISSLRTPTALYDLFPGLRRTHQIDVDTITLDSLLAQESLESGQGNWLIIDTPGTEAEMVKVLQEAEKLDVFDRIDLNCGRQPLYEDSELAATLLTRILEQGYEVHHCDEETDPDRPRWSLARQPLKVDNLRLQAELQECSDRFKGQVETIDNLQVQLEERTRERDDLQKTNAVLKSELAEFERREDMTREEMSRAEQQIALIKDLVLRDIDS